MIGKATEIFIAKICLTLLYFVTVLIKYTWVGRSVRIDCFLPLFHKTTSQAGISMEVTSMVLVTPV